MLMRTDPFRELDHFSQQLFGMATRPSAMPIDAYRKANAFYVHFDVPGVDPASIDLTVEENVLAVRAERPPMLSDGAKMIVSERPARRHLHPSAVPCRDARCRPHRSRLQRRGADPHHPGDGGGQAAQAHHNHHDDKQLSAAS